MPVQPAGPNEALLVRLRLILCQRNAVECAINIYMWFWIPKARASSTVSVSQGRDIFRLVQALVRVRVEVVLFLGSVRNRLPPGRFAHAAGVRRHDGRREVGPAQRAVPVLVDELDDTPPVQQHRLPKPQVPALARTGRACSRQRFGYYKRRFSLSLTQYLPAMAFYDLGHVAVVGGYEDIALQGHHVVQRSHLGGVVLEQADFPRQQRLLSNLLARPRHSTR